MVRASILVILLIGFSVLIGCGRPAADAAPSDSGAEEGVLQQMQKPLEKAGEYSQQAAQKLQSDIGERLAGADRQIEQLESKGQNLSGDARVRFQESIQKVREKRQTLSEELSKLRGATAQTWNNVTDDVGAAWSELQKSIRDAMQEFGGSDTGSSG